MAWTPRDDAAPLAARITMMPPGTTNGFVVEPLEALEGPSATYEHEYLGFVRGSRKMLDRTEQLRCTVGTLDPRVEEIDAYAHAREVGAQVLEHDAVP